MSTAARVALFAACALVGGCGKPLGTYQVRDVKLVAGESMRRVEPDIDADPQMLRVEFVSGTDLYEASDGGHEGLYVFASFCPFQDRSPLSVTAPYYNDWPRWNPVTRADRRPAKDPATGTYVYTTYLRLQGDTEVNRGEGVLDATGYDLRKRQTDLCLRIEHPGYFITPSQSQVFVLPAAMIHRVLASSK